MSRLAREGMLRVEGEPSAINDPNHLNNIDEHNDPNGLNHYNEQSHGSF